MSPIQATAHFGAPAMEQPVCFDPSVFELQPNPVIFGRYLPTPQATPEASTPDFTTSPAPLDTPHDTPSPRQASSPASPTTSSSDASYSSSSSSSSSSSNSPASTPRSDPPSPSAFPHQCTHCSESYRLSGDLRKHWFRRHEKRFACDVCKQQFNLKADLKRHTRSKHAVKAEIGCEVRGCPATFTRRDNMMRHIKEEHEHGGRKGSK